MKRVVLNIIGLLVMILLLSSSSMGVLPDPILVYDMEGGTGDETEAIAGVVNLQEYGTITSCTGIHNNCRESDGTDSNYLMGQMFGNLEFNETNMTMSFWVQYDNIAGGLNRVFMAGHDDQSGDKSFFFGCGDVWGPGEKCNSGIRYENTIDEQQDVVPGLSGGSWELFVLIRNETNKLHTYRNTTLLTTVTSTKELGADDDLMTIFVQRSVTNVSGGGMDGRIDEFYIWDEALTQTQIEELWNNGTGDFYPYTTPGDTITFLLQQPDDIIDVNTTQGINITYDINISGGANLSTTYLNWSINGSGAYTNGFQFVNGSTEKTGVIQDFTGTNTSNNWTWVFNDGILPGTYNYDEEIMESTPHDIYNLTALNQVLKIRFYNVSINKEINNFEFYINSSGACNIFYCNDNYTTGNPAAQNDDCTIIGQASNPGFDHIENLSRHNIFGFSVINNLINGVGVSSTSYMVIRGTQDGTCQYGAIPNVTREDQVQTSSNTGATYSNAAYTPDAHIHQFNTTDTFYYYACSMNSTGEYICGATQYDTLNSSVRPPSTVTFIKPVEDEVAYTSLEINFTPSVAFNGANITRYVLDLLNDDLSLNQSITGLDNTTTYYLYAVGSLDDTFYHIRVNATDTYNQTTMTISPRWEKDTQPTDTEILLGDINSSLTSVINNQNEVNGGINMIGLMVFNAALLFLVLLVKKNSLKTLVALFTILHGLYLLANKDINSLSPIMSVAIVFVGVVYMFLDIEDTKYVSRISGGVRR